MKKYPRIISLSAITASAITLASMSTNAAIIYNVNIGSTDLAGYQGASPSVISLRAYTI